MLGNYIPVMSGKSVLEVPEEQKIRIRSLADGANTTIKDATKVILGWALDQFEGEQVRLQGVCVAEPVVKGGLS
ncbi:hypothetical protein SAMN02745181_0388 [Rubritalea squalenifaciens DSM 18772]|uniref:Uncharacterized protein n=3 Tax=Rubritaleaceae TaxID=1648490 RepID=A0A1M6C4Z5_9BACT|nr:hypothetical protein SAMN02745181_0388 [Rubritalea squalenifaciens DSM 18772]